MRNNWIFQLAQTLTLAQKEQITLDIKAFLNLWNAHGTPVPGKAEIKYDRFILLNAEPETTSGCSIDSMSKEVAKILDQAGAKRVESNFVFFKTDSGEINYVDFREIENLIANGKINSRTIVFDNSLGQADDILRWESPLKDTWLAKYLPVNAK